MPGAAVKVSVLKRALITEPVDPREGAGVRIPPGRGSR